MINKYYISFQLLWGVGCLVFGWHIAAGFSFGLAWSSIAEDIADWWADR